MRKSMVVAAALAAALGCSRDLSLPPPPAPPPEPGPASIAGRVVYAQPGAQAKLAAYGARVELLGTGRVAYADAEGRFVLDDIDFAGCEDPGAGSCAQQLLVQFDPGATGTPSRQRLYDLGAFSPRPGLQITIDEVAVNENARLRGMVLRGDNATAGGHAGTVVYVPQGPFTTFTNDDGSFELRDMPEGTVSVAAFRTGYASLVVDAIALRAGEDFQMREITVAPLVGGGTGSPGRISGTVTYGTAPGGAGVTSVSAVDGSGGSHSAAADAGGAFLIENVPPGVYQITAVRLGYGAAIVPNVAVAPDGETLVTGLRLEVEGGAGACVPNTVCQPPGAGGLCKVGVTSCTGGTSCNVAGNALDGTACGDGAVCRAGECKPVCDAGRVCTPSNPCHVGVVVCAQDGSASCVDIGAELPVGYACGEGRSCTPVGGVMSCEDCVGAACGTCSVQCVPANPCHVGARDCSGGPGSACNDTGLLAADGSGCGTNRVCRAGSCVPCAEGASCELSSNVCKLGFVSCATGFAVCTEAGNKADGTPCASGDACRGGVCLPAGGQVQTLVDSDYPYSTFRGVAVASNGDVYYADSYNNTVNRLAAGATDPVVIAGRPGSYGDSADNQPAVDATLYSPYALALDEPAGLLYVSDTYNNRIRAVQLGGNRWILRVAGGGAPSPNDGDDGPATSAVLYQPTQLALGADGGRRYLYFRDDAHYRFRRVDLGSGRIEAWNIPTDCYGSPVALSSCGGTNSCGIAPAGSHGMFVSGYVCGTKVGTATYGILRIPPGGGTPVHVLGRSPGIQTEGGYARDTNVNEPPGLAVDAAGSLYYATFASNRIRRISPTGVVRTVAGTGAAGTAGDGGTALEATFDGPVSLAFRPGQPSPGVDAYVVESRGNVVRRVLGLGSAVFERGTLSGSTGLAQSAVIGRSPPEFAGATLLDASGGAMPGFEVGAQPSSTPPGTLVQTTALTDVNGTASFALRVGFLPDDYTFRASYQDIYGVDVPGSPVTFTATATEPAPGTIMTLVNENRLASTAGIPGFGPLASVYYPTSAAAGPDGTVYVSAYYSHRVFAISPEGTIRAVAGNGGAGSQGDGGQAVDAQLYYPWGIALDDQGRRLFIADTSNHKVRVVDLQSGIIGTLAGTGSAGTAGDAGPANLAQLYYPTTVAHGGGKLFVGQAGSGIRVVDLAATPPTIDSAVPPLPGGAPSCAGDVTFNYCVSTYGCGMAVDAAGDLYFSGYACGVRTAGYHTYAIMKWDGVAVTHVAGRYVYDYDNSDGAAAARSNYPQAPALAFGPGGRLFVVDINNHKVRFIDFSGAEPTNWSWFASGTGGYAGNYVNVDTDPFAVQLYYPTSIAFTPAPESHAVVVDYYNHAVRMVWKAGQTMAP